MESTLREEQIEKKLARKEKMLRVMRRINRALIDCFIVTLVGTVLFTMVKMLGGY